MISAFRPAPVRGKITLMDNLILAVAILLPLSLAYFLRSNGAASFLTLSGGFTLMTLSGGDLEQLVGKVRITSLSSSNLDLALLGLPLLLTLLLTHKSAPSSGMRRWLHAVCALLAGALLALLTAPMASDVFNTSYSASVVWKDLQKFQSTIVGVGFILSLLLVWFKGSKKSEKKH